MTTKTKERPAHIDVQSVAGRQKCEVYSRVVGYLSPVQRWNKGKVAEYNQRKTFSICPCTK